MIEHTKYLLIKEFIENDFETIPKRIRFRVIEIYFQVINEVCNFMKEIKDFVEHYLYLSKIKSTCSGNEYSIYYIGNLNNTDVFITLIYWLCEIIKFI